MKQHLTSLRSATDGSVAIEFAIAGPVLLGMLFGVLQIGIGMQNYNALRGITADVARYAVVNYQTSNRLTTAQLQAYAAGIATRAPYGLTQSRLTATVTTPASQRITGATEYTITISYRVPTMLGVIGVTEIPINYSRPVFVLTTV